MTRPQVSLAVFWTAGILALNIFVFGVNDHVIRSDITEYIGEYLETTLDDSLFGDGRGVVNDRSSLLDVGERINRMLDRLVADRWHAVFSDCRVALSAIDDVSIRSSIGTDQTIVVDLRRNATRRPVVVNYACSHSVWPYALWTAAAVVLFALLYRSLPPPLTSRQRRRHGSLVAQGYDTDDATHLVTAFESEYDRLSFRQRSVFARLHQPEAHNYEQALRAAGRRAVASFPDDSVEWFVLAVERKESTDRAEEIALHPDIVEIDLTQATLSIHGMYIPIGGTPLFYYAWYALDRLSGDGWITNPRSNRPDKIAAASLSALLRRHHGHARAVSDLEGHGLKAKTLDQNRSKIKDAVSAVLGERLSRAYLFEARRDRLTQRMSYRINLPAERLEVKISTS